MSVEWINPNLLDTLSAQAADTPRRRKNHNFHRHETDLSHRLLNAIEPGSYVAPHRHQDPTKDETLIVLRGRLGVLLFDDEGTMIERAILTPGGRTLGLTIPHGTWHSVVSLTPGTVFFEAKAGPYQALGPQERAAWAPTEGSETANAFLSRMRAALGN